MSGASPLEHLAARLEDAARRLREPDLADEEAHRLVEECAQLAGQAGAELDRRVREAKAGDEL
jgi:hypothetical protein